MYFSFVSHRRLCIHIYYKVTLTLLFNFNDFMTLQIEKNMNWQAGKNVFNIVHFLISNDS